MKAALVRRAISWSGRGRHPLPNAKLGRRTNSHRATASGQLHRRDRSAYVPRMARITVTPEKLRTAILIWLRVMPKQVWRRYEEYERKAAEKRHSEEDDPKAREELADYLTGRFAQAN
jgi:hypothetical protein